MPAEAPDEATNPKYRIFLYRMVDVILRSYGYEHRITSSCLLWMQLTCEMVPSLYDAVGTSGSPERRACCTYVLAWSILVWRCLESTAPFQNQRAESWGVTSKNMTTQCLKLGRWHLPGSLDLMIQANLQKKRSQSHLQL
ncbi:hypothetical protein Y1Q_0002042 [Alligator mississippiensis]|uniref:Uncharacterized protein n=1 Tax=Alligator mississippiensis TaxID=8496 RepID=A0A151MIQ3_ALLMI|nr:hypothetical protein Y1Q_0002042 [Alligator mississippiensis]